MRCQAVRRCRREGCGSTPLVAKLVAESAQRQHVLHPSRPTMFCCDQMCASSRRALPVALPFAILAGLAPGSRWVVGESLWIMLGSCWVKIAKGIARYESVYPPHRSRTASTACREGWNGACPPGIRARGIPPPLSLSPGKRQGRGRAITHHLSPAREQGRGEPRSLAPRKQRKHCLHRDI